MPYSRKDRRQHADGRTGRISCHSARRTGGAPRPLGKVVLPLERWQQGPQRPQTFHDTACGDHGLQPDGTRVDSWVGRVKDDPYNEVLRENLPGVLTNEAGVICRVAADQLARQWGTTPAPPTETDPGFTKSDGRFNVSGKQPWEKLVESQYSLADDTLRLWAATPQNLRSFEQTFYSCLVAVDGGLNGLPVTNDMPDTEEREKPEAKRTAKWLCSLLVNPDRWPSSNGGRHAAAHAPRLHRLRTIFLVESKWTEPRHLIQPVMAARARAFDVLDDTSDQGDGEYLGMGTM